MNDKFFSLPQNKQQRIISAAYKVFALNNYKKAPMSEIACEAEISKALLFHYFRNKEDLYLYLWNNAVELTRKAIIQYKTTQTSDFFEMLKRSLLAKCSLMRNYPYIYQFSLQAYYETEPEIKQVVQDSFFQVSQISAQTVFEMVDKSPLRTDIELSVMYQEIIYAVDGYMLGKYRSGKIDADEIEIEIGQLIALWRTVYTRQ